jgi:hypothetical protein
VLDLAQTRRYARQIALPEVGLAGQERLCAARVVVVGDDLAARTAAEYLAGAGVGRVEARAVPATAEGWAAAFDGVALAVRSGFEDDAMLGAAVRAALPVIVMRGRNARVDVLALRRHGPCPHARLDVPALAPEQGSEDGPGAVLAGTIAAAEALWLLIDPAAGPRARHLRLPLDGGPPIAQEIPWSPECFLCGGAAREASFT